MGLEISYGIYMNLYWRSQANAKNLHNFFNFDSDHSISEKKVLHRMLKISAVKSSNFLKIIRWRASKWAEKCYFSKVLPKGDKKLRKILIIYSHANARSENEKLINNTRWRLIQNSKNIFFPQFSTWYF